MKQATLGLVLVLATVSMVTGILPEEEKFEAVFKGEGVSCDGTLAKVEVNSNTVVETEEGVATAVAEAVANAIAAVENDPSVTTVVAQADSSAKVVVEAVATAIATVAAEINSPATGCWAIAFGKAEAVAVAQASATAVAQAFAEAQQNGLISADALAAVEASTIETDIEVVVEAVALLLADGSGNGAQSKTATAEAEARAKAVNCAFAAALATVVDGVAEADALAQAGCDEAPPPEIDIFAFPGAKGTALGSCDCVQTNSWGAPNGCGLWGDVQNGDYICYVREPNNCGCAQSSGSFSGSGWRYCGPTLNLLQEWLSFEDENSQIVSTEPKWGYCGQLNYQDDAIVQAPDASPIPSPSPSPSPTPGVPIVKDCPRFRCLGDSSSCCSQSGPTCTSTTFGNTYNYLGQCASTGQDVWARPSSFFECVC